MHEIGLCESVVAAIEKRAAGRPVAGAKLRVGVLHRVVPEAFGQAFELVCAGTAAEGAEVELVAVPVHVRCACGLEADLDGLPPACPRCGGGALEVTGGDELVLESIRLRPAATEPAGPAQGG